MNELRYRRLSYSESYTVNFKSSTMAADETGKFSQGNLRTYLGTVSLYRRF
jgi:hypothetical protein